jgi:hypothetical protein
MNLTKRHLFTHKVDVNLDVLGAKMLKWVGNHVNGIDIVTEDHNCTSERLMKFTEELAYPVCIRVCSE